MRDRIARALVRVLTHLPLTRRTRPGRHTTHHLTTHHLTTQPTTTPAAPTEPTRPWARPWPGPSSAEARAVFHAPETHHLAPEHREQYYATAWAARGYTYRPHIPTSQASA
ncbi:hypothetical protein [Streptomyces sp. NPDC049906]|uniref:hypothetical protein n=1 Tax=Streptomyces sp. NPDC049906 TaxID=3155656 RepID=UPI00341CE87F